MPNISSEVDQDEQIVRFECVTHPMNEAGCDLVDLENAVREKNIAFLSEFCSKWNRLRDNRPAFATLLREVRDEIQCADWPDQLRDRLGLANYSAIGSPIPVALMQYSVGEVLAADRQRSMITMPTVLDGEPSAQYFPAHQSLRFGRAMALLPCERDDQLKIELLNSRINYKPEHFKRVGYIRTRIPDYDIADLRERHLMAVQMAASDYGFG